MPSSLTVVIPTRNRRAFLREALASVQNQSLRVTTVFVSDNSDEPDFDLPSEFPDMEIRYVHHDPVLPMREHWIWCLENAPGDYLAWLEDDNLFRREHLEILSGALDQFPEAALAGSSTISFSARHALLPHDVFTPAWPCDLLTLSNEYISREVILGLYLFGTPFASSAVMVRKSLLESYRFVPGPKISQDRWLWAQILSLGGAVLCPPTTALYREHSSQAVKTFSGHQFREDGRNCTELIVELMDRNKISMRECFVALCLNLTLGSRRQMSLHLFLERDLALWKELSPHLLPETSLAKRYGCILMDFTKKKIRQVVDRF